MMRIVLDAYQSGPATTGTERVAANLLRELQRIDTTNEYVVLVHPDRPAIASALHAENFRALPIRQSKRVVSMAVGLPVLLRRLRADCFYSFHNFYGPSVRVCRTIVTILDLIPITHPELRFGDARFNVKRTLVSAMMRRAVAVADEFTSISQFTVDEAVRELPINGRSLTILPHGVDAQFRASLDAAGPPSSAIELPRSFVLTIGGTERRKNVANVVAAHRLLPDDLRAEFPLLIAGGRGTNTDEPHVRWLGFVSDQELSTLYRSATTFVFASTYEGFGLPLLEAMATETVVACSDTTSLPEVAGDAAMYFDPNDVADIATAIEKLLRDPELRDALVERGRQRLQSFSWVAPAQALHQRLVSNRSNGVHP